MTFTIHKVRNIMKPINIIDIGKEVYFMPILQKQPEITTIKQYEQISEDIRAEIFEGFIYDMASPSTFHQRLSLRLAAIIDSYIIRKKGDCEVFTAPYDVVLSKKPLVIVQPDIMVVCDKKKLDSKRCNDAPDFIIEITSPSTASHDYIQKSYYYQRYGVREYWIVDMEKQTVTVHYFEGGSFSSQYPFNSSVKVNIYDDLEIDFAEISERLGLKH